MKILVDAMPKTMEDCPYCHKNNFIDRFITNSEYCCRYTYQGECHGVDSCPHFLGVPRLLGFLNNIDIKNVI